MEPLDGRRVDTTCSRGISVRLCLWVALQLIIASQAKAEPLGGRRITKNGVPEASLSDCAYGLLTG